MRALSYGVKCFPDIISLQLQNNRISDKGAAVLFQNLSPNLETLDISDNMIG